MFKSSETRLLWLPPHTRTPALKVGEHWVVNRETHKGEDSVKNLFPTQVISHGLECSCMGDLELGIFHPQHQPGAPVLKTLQSHGEHGIRRG